MEFQHGPHDCDQSAFLVSFQMGAEVVVDEQPVGVGLGEGDHLILLHQVLQGGGRRLGHVVGPDRAVSINPLLMGGAVSMVKCFMSLFSWSGLFLPRVCFPPACLLVLDDVAAVGEEVECRCPDHGCGFFATWSHVAGLLCAWIQLGVHFPDGYLPGQLRRLGVRSLLVYHRVIPPFRPGPAAAASHGAGTGRQLRRCYSFGESFTSPGGDAMPDDSRQQASISRTVLDRA